MSKENLEQFMSKVADSEELQAKMGEQIDAESLIALGVECGCEFTAEELQESAELSDEELDGMAGGSLSRSVTTDRITHAARLQFTTPEGGTLLRAVCTEGDPLTDAVGPLMYNVRRKAGAVSTDAAGGVGEDMLDGVLG